MRKLADRLNEVARASGLLEYTYRQLPDPFGEQIYVTYEWGFVTKVLYRVMGNEKREKRDKLIIADEKLNAEPSEVVFHDGTDPKFSHKWSHWWVDDSILYRRDFRVPGATFAAVARRGVPERVFLFVKENESFNLDAVLVKLLDWREAHKPPDWLVRLRRTRRLLPPPSFPGRPYA